MEGAQFYWIAWFIWVGATFLLNKDNTYRYNISRRLLILVILSPINFSLFGYQIYLSGIYLFIAILSDISRYKRRTILYYFLTSFIITLAYVSFLLFELFDPVWIFVDRQWMLSFIMLYLTFMLQTTLQMRLYIMLTGAIQGEVLYAFVIKKIGFPYEISSLAFLDLAALTAALLLTWSGLKFSAAYLDSHFNISKGRSINHHE